ncbi:hypothetical protein P170DRAFT_119929 [Aspergillus steynii IBT 23096]|uniref:Uncharacterized protein n=1 Tax=Aspergillus steynii IBT 23096 TaxID=1392250 RepID=A0A2I2GJD1_9EURO|nr:uncharacterized protein P170DRAFT_119929 [Aspergillus steynii IBT 23096]PLB52978.1 hypothetical protein P170DRAFT_119929 [Aspergillus steynii IBT 23096]
MDVQGNPRESNKERYNQRNERVGKRGDERCGGGGRTKRRILEGGERGREGKGRGRRREEVRDGRRVKSGRPGSLKGAREGTSGPRD